MCYRILASWRGRKQLNTATLCSMLTPWQCWERQRCGQLRFLPSQIHGVWWANSALIPAQMLLTHDVVQILFKHATGSNLQNALNSEFVLVWMLPLILFSSVIKVCWLMVNSVLLTMTCGVCQFHCINTPSKTTTKWPVQRNWIQS